MANGNVHQRKVIFLKQYLKFYRIDTRYLQLFSKSKEYELNEQKLWSTGRALGSQSEGCGFDPYPMLDGSGVKAMPGSIPTPNSGSL